MGASCGSIYLFFPCARSAIYPSRDLKFSRYPLLLTLMQLTSTGPTFVAPKINIQETQQKYLFPNVMTQLLTNIHRPYCAWPHRKLLFTEVRKECIYTQSLNQRTPVFLGAVWMLYFHFRWEEIQLYFICGWTAALILEHQLFIRCGSKSYKMSFWKLYISTINVFHSKCHVMV